MYKLKITAMILALLLMLTAFTGCNNSEEAVKDIKKEQTQQQSAKSAEANDTEDKLEETATENKDTLIWNLSYDPKTFDPVMTTSPDGGYLINNIFEGLLRDVGDGDIQPACAESYEISDDGTVYTFKIRHGLEWSDGTPITARDFEYSWKRICDPNTASPYSFIFTPYVKGAQACLEGTGNRDDVKAEATDDYTFRVELNFPVPYFLGLTTFYTYMPVKQDIIEKSGDGWEKNPDTCVSNGPFKMIEYQVGSHIMLQKNENYWDKDAVKLPYIKALMIEEANTAMSGYEAGEIAILSKPSIPADEIPRLRAEDPNLIITPQIGTTYDTFNVDAAPLNDVRVRRALTLAVDRKKLCEQVMKGGQIPATGVVPPALSFSDGTCFRKLDENGNPAEEYGIDPAKAQVEEARELLKEAGYPDGQGFPTLTYIYDTNQNNKKTAEALQEMWKTNLNIDIELRNMDYAVYLNAKTSGDFMIAASGWTGDYADPMTMLDLFTSSSGNNDSQWRWNEQPVVAPDDHTLNPENKEFDEVIYRAQKTMGKERDELLKRSEEILMENAVVLPLFYNINIYIIDSGAVEGVTRSAMQQWLFKYAELTH